MVLHGGVDIAQLYVRDACLLFDILVQTVTVGTHPHIAIFVEQHVLQRVLTDRGLVELVVHETARFLGFRIDDPQSFVVSTQPEPVAMVLHHHPRQHIVGQALDALRPKEAVDGVIPFLLFLTIDIARDRCQHPEVAAIVNIQIIGAFLLSAVLAHVGIFPHHLSLRAVNSHQVAVTGRHDEQVVIFCKRREPELVGELIRSVAVLDECTLLRLGVIAVETVGIGLHPQVLLRIDIDAVDTARDAQLGQHRRRIAHRFLRHRVEERVVHALLQPQLSVEILPDHINVVAAQRQRVVGIGIKRTETVAVVTVQTIRGAYPDIALGILEETVQLGI